MRQINEIVDHIETLVMAKTNENDVMTCLLYTSDAADE